MVVVPPFQGLRSGMVLYSQGVALGFIICAFQAGGGGASGSIVCAFQADCLSETKSRARFWQGLAGTAREIQKAE